MDKHDGSRSRLQPITFYEDPSIPECEMRPLSRTQLEQEIARRTADRFSTKALRAALFPQHEGIIDHPDGCACTHGECGDLISFYLRVEDGRISVVRFTTDGCDATIAAGEMLATMVTGMSREKAGRVTADDLLAALDGLPSNHTHCAALAVKTLSKAIASCEGGTEVLSERREEPTHPL
jgi:nitrogen fixation NifU-like protein